jgi:hypothetical protein
VRLCYGGSDSDWQVPRALAYFIDWLAEIWPIAVPGEWRPEQGGGAKWHPRSDLVDLNGAIAAWAMATRTQLFPREFVLLKDLLAIAVIAHADKGAARNFVSASNENVAAVLGGYSPKKPGTL